MKIGVLFFFLCRCFYMKIGLGFGFLNKMYSQLFALSITKNSKTLTDNRIIVAWHFFGYWWISAYMFMGVINASITSFSVHCSAFFVFVKMSHINEAQAFGLYFWDWLSPAFLLHFLSTFNIRFWCTQHSFRHRCNSHLVNAYAICNTQSATPPQRDQRLHICCHFEFTIFPILTVRLLWKFTYEWIDWLIYFFLCVYCVVMLYCSYIMESLNFDVWIRQCCCVVSFFICPWFFTYSLSHCALKIQKLMPWVMPLVHAMHSIILNNNERKKVPISMTKKCKWPHSLGFVYLFLSPKFTKSFISSFAHCYSFMKFTI